MKKSFFIFLAGMLTMLLLGTLTISTLAISGHMTIEVDPINVMVNGEVFQPKDGLGRDVPVFVYNGTTYAPLRALAEAYGLEVGYDAEKNLATVNNSDKTAVGKQQNVIEKYDVNLIKIEDKYYYIDQFYEKDKATRFLKYYSIEQDGEKLIFCNDISYLASGSYYYQWYPAYYAIGLAKGTFTITDGAENPYIDGAIKLDDISLAYKKVLETGKGEKEYVSVKDYIEPTWMKCNGVKIYRNDDQGYGLHEKGGIRYYNSDICLNDLLKKLGYDCKIQLGDYDGLKYLEIN